MESVICRVYYSANAGKFSTALSGVIMLTQSTATVAIGMECSESRRRTISLHINNKVVCITLQEED